jgi:hypothetical protein
MVMAACEQANAYVDPGSGALIWQMLCAVFIGVLFQSKKIIAFFKSKFKKWLFSPCHPSETLLGSSFS